MTFEEEYKRFDQKEKQINEQDIRAREQGNLVGRIIRHPYADGYAVYEIIKENKKTVRVSVVTGIGDDWVLPAWGYETSIPKESALRFIRNSDIFAEIFGAEA